jgi:hypothetical protein
MISTSKKEDEIIFKAIEAVENDLEKKEISFSDDPLNPFHDSADEQKV